MITIKEVAELAGVSKATVSRVLNNSGYVSVEVRKKVEDIIKEYDYLPSASAVNLSKQETSIVGVVVPEIDNMFYADIVHGITEIADELNLSLILFDTQNSLEKEERAIRALQHLRVRGIILDPSVDYPETKEGRLVLEQLKGLRLPIVIVDRDFTNMPWDAVLYENYESSYAVAQELYKAGNRRLAVITGDMSLKIGRDRLEGFRRGAEDCGLTIRKEDILYGDFLMETAYELSKQLFTRGDLPDAVYTSNNRTSLGFLKAANECGIKVGEDIALMGNDRIETVDILGIALSCVYRDNYEMGRTAVRMLQERMSKPNKSRSISIIPHKVRLKGSEKKS